MHYVGEIRLFPYNFAPMDWQRCEGQIMDMYLYLDLFAILGTTFGGDGTTTFGLPDLRGKAPDENMFYYIAVEGVYPSLSM